MNSAYSEKFDIQKLKLYERNPRKISQKAVDAVAKSIRMNGALDPIEIDEEGVILAGHTRYKAYKELGYNEVPVIQHIGLTPTQKKTYRIASNKTAEYSEWDDEILAAELKDIDMEIEKLQESTGIKENDLREALDETLVDAEPQINKADELQKKWQVQRGDIYRIGTHRLMCGDSTSADDVGKLMDGKKADMLLNDPPYGMRLDADYSKMVGRMSFLKDKGVKSGIKYPDVIGDDKDFDASGICKLFDYVKEQIWFGADYYSATLPDTMHSGAWIMWDKRIDDSGDRMFGSCFEMIWSKEKHKRDILRHKWAGIFGTENEEQRGRFHPNQKPQSLYTDIIQRYCVDNGHIIDLFLGSGSTMVAAQNTGRICYGMEISPAYCSVILERMKTAFPDINIEKVQ